MPEHKNIIDAERHPVKGASSAITGQVYSAIAPDDIRFVYPNSLINIGLGPSIEASSTAVQTPTASDTPYTVLYGAGVDTTDVNISTAGLITFKTAGLYFITFSFNFGRTTNTGTSILAARLLLNSAQVGFTQTASIDASKSTVPNHVTLLRSVTAASTMSVQLIRSSLGAADGGLYPVNPTVAGWAISPSAAVRIQRVVGGA